MIVVAIDGPAGSGKSTVARLLARRLGVPHVDTGAYYRAATLAVLRAGVDPGDAETVADVLTDARIDRVDDRTLLDGADVEEEIRGPAVTHSVSTISAHQRVRELLLAAQRAGITRDGGVVEGRDAATRIVPDADVKVWLDAGLQERARRRAEQAGEPDRTGFHLDDLQRRDAADTRQMARDLDAVIVDTTDMTVEQVVDHVAGLALQASGRRP